MMYSKWFCLKRWLRKTEGSFKDIVCLGNGENLKKVLLFFWNKIESTHILNHVDAFETSALSGVGGA